MALSSSNTTLARNTRSVCTAIFSSDGHYIAVQTRTWCSSSCTTVYTFDTVPGSWLTCSEDIYNNI